jgi:hypothetical protein
MRSLAEAQAEMASRHHRDWLGAKDHMVWHCGFHPEIKFFLQSAPRPLANGATPICRAIVRGEEIVYDTDPQGTIIAAPTNVAFGGADGCTLYIASLARWHSSKIQLDVPGLPLCYPM